MQPIWSVVTVLVVLAVTAGPVVGAQTDWQVRQTLEIGSEPLDMVVNAKSQRAYVLNKQGEIRVYAMDGTLKGKIDVGAEVFQIKAGPKDGVLYLLSRKSQSIKAISIDVTENIDTKNSPFKGSQAAPVTIAVFSDFQ